MDDLALENHLDHCVDELKHYYGELPEEELLRRHSDRLFHLDLVLNYCEHVNEPLPGSGQEQHQSSRERGSNGSALGLANVVTRLFSRHRTVEPELDLDSFFSPPSRIGNTSSRRSNLQHRRYNNESQPLWTLPIPEEKIETARTCSHRLMLTRTRGAYTIYSCARCGFWLDSSQACLEDAVLMWADYADACDRVWKEKKRAHVLV